VDAIGALEAQINQLHDFAEVLRQQLEATREDRDRWRQRAQHLMLELKVLSGSPWWKRLTDRKRKS
jgi:prefoldin subunit 5